LGVGVVLIALTALAGWLFHLPLLRSILPSAEQMKLNTALLLILAGVSLLLQTGASGGRRRLATGILAGLVAVGGAVTLLEYLVGWRLGIDEILMRDDSQVFRSMHGRMSPYSAVGFLAIGFALLAMHHAAPRRFVVPGAIIAAAIGTISALGYLWGARELTTDQVLPPVAINTAAAFMALGAGIWLASRTPAMRDPEPAAVGGIENKVLMGFIAALSLLFLAGGITYRMGVSFANSAQWVSDAQRARAALGDLYAAIADAEGAQRDYLLAGTADYRLEYQRVAADVRARLTALQPMLMEDSMQLLRLRVLGSSIEGRLNALSHQLDEYDSVGGDAARLAIADDEGISSLKSIRAILRMMDVSEAQQLSARTEQLERNRGLTLFALVSTLGIATTALVLLFRSITRDIRERARIARALDEAQREAQRATRAKSEFLAVMSHEIRTPMNGVIGMIDVLHQSSLIGPQVEMVNLIRESADSLLTIIDDILDFSKIEAGRLELESAPMSVAAAVEKTCSLLNRLAERKGITLTVFVDPAIPERVLGDAARLRQVLVNLANNAIKFSSGLSRAGRVAVRAVLAEQQADRSIVEFRIIDNGIGMDAQTVGKAFTSFMQADASTTRKYGGTGLGLAISRQLAVLMGGDIQIVSEPGAGSTFTVRLPFAPAPAGAAAASAAETSLIRDLPVIVVGGPQGIADDLAIYLASESATVARVADLAAARAWTQARPPGLAVWVVDAGENLLAHEELERLIRTRADPILRAVLVVVGRGRRRSPRAEANGLIIIDGNALTRQALSRAVAIAAGRAGVEPAASSGKSRTLSASAPSRDEAIAGKRLILVAEDNHINQKVIRQQLELLGFAADVAADGRDALNRLKNGQYALLLTDLHMPEMDGYDLTLAARVAEGGRTHMPIIALTANALKGEAERCRAVGMDDYLRKPASLTELAALLERWLPRAGSAALASESTVTPPVDVAVLKSFVGEDELVIDEVLQDFLESATRMGHELIESGEKSDVAQAASVAHKLKSSARSVGALRLAELCALVEGAGMSGDAAACSLLMAQLETELTAVRDYLQNRLSPGGASKRYA
jgi:signal transduction histidine kinase/CheY-like chemotaxis protein